VTDNQSTSLVTLGDRRRVQIDDQGSGEISPWDLLRSIWARKELVGGIFAVFMLLVILWLGFVTPTYTVESRVLLSPRSGEISSFDAQTQPLNPDAETVQSELQVLTSRPLLLRLVRDLKLESNPEFRPAQGLLSRILGFDAPRTSENNAVDRVARQLRVYQMGTSRVLAIEFTSTNPRTAAIVANRMAELYIDQQIDRKNEINSEATRWLSSQIDELRSKVLASEAAVEAFRAQSGLLMTNGTTLPQQQLTDLNAQLGVAEAARAEAQAKLANARAMHASGVNVNASAEVLQSPLIQSLRGQEVTLRAQIAQMLETLLPTHPRVMEAQANLADLELQIEREVRKITSALESEAKVASGRVAAIRADLNKLQERMGTANQDDVKLRSLERDAAANRTLLESYLKRYEEATSRIGADDRTSDARIVSRAEIPGQPTFPKKGSVLFLATIAGLIIAFLSALLIEVFSRGFRTADQLERVTGMPFLGVLPELDGVARNGGPVAETMRDPYGLYAEAIRGLQGNVLTARVGQNRARSVLVTSSHSGEGKSTTAASLARILALGGYRTILIDADLRAPSLQLLLGMEPTAGLAELLTGRAHFGQVIRQDYGSYAHVMQAGGQLANPTAALASSQMLWILRALEQTYDFIIIDSPAVMAAADAQVLAKIADVTVLVVRWSQTSRRVVKRVLKTLSAVSGRRVGVLLSRVNLRRYRRLTDTVLEEYPVQNSRVA